MLPKNKFITPESKLAIIRVSEHLFLRCQILQYAYEESDHYRMWAIDQCGRAEEFVRQFHKEKEFTVQLWEPLGSLKKWWCIQEACFHEVSGWKNFRHGPDTMRPCVESVEFTAAQISYINLAEPIHSVIRDENVRFLPSSMAYWQFTEPEVIIRGIAECVI